MGTSNSPVAATLKAIFKFIFLLLIAIILFVVILFGILTLTEYKPESEETLEYTNRDTMKSLSIGDSVDILTWNVGYCGLSKTADFFMDGGTSVRSQDEDSVSNNLEAIGSFLEEKDADMLFLQEVDHDCTRTYGIPEDTILEERLSSYGSVFAKNFDVLYIPYPIPPMGHMDAGILTLSKYEVSDATRIQLPCPFSWPYRLGNLKRCLSVSRVGIENSDKEFVFVNLHLEAYDDGEGKAAQTAQLAGFIQAEYEKGNYVVAGGDFNQTFSSVDTSAYPLQNEGLWMCGTLNEEDFASNWQFAMDNSTPTCRSLDRAYDATDDTFQFYMIDGFIVSDNLTINSIETIDKGFENTDHNPVEINVTIKE
ncbi:MAG: endonuclease/exonuclease/phosphatase family protein [Lachnospiraceae bacterium]|nr:endonuclease/exonuclease/phosphatase family protein [Lachnospiraceae bacterium]